MGDKVFVSCLFLFFFFNVSYVFFYFAVQAFVLNSIYLGFFIYIILDTRLKLRLNIFFFTAAVRE